MRDGVLDTSPTTRYGSLMSRFGVWNRARQAFEPTDIRTYQQIIFLRSRYEGLKRS